LVAQLLKRQELQFPIQVNVMTDEETKEFHLKRLYELSIKSIGKIPLLEESSNEQKEWILHRLHAPDWTWQRWHDMIEEWTPWNRFGKWVNVWRCYNK